MLSLQTMKFNQKIVLLAFIPLAGLLLMSSFIALKQMSEMQKTEKIIELADLSVYVSNLVHELQKERGLSAGFIGSHGEKFKQEVEQQRQATDHKYQQLKHFLDQSDTNANKGLNSELGNINSKLDQLGSIRQNISNLSMTGAEVIEFYSNLNAAYLEIIAQIAQLSTNVGSAQKLAAYSYFLKGKEQAGIERAVLTNTFANDAFAKGMFEKLVTLIAVQNTYMAVFVSVAPHEYGEFLETNLSGQLIDETSRMRRKALDNFDKGGFGIDPAYWFKTQTDKINLLKKIEDFISEDVISSSKNMKKLAIEHLVVNIAFIVGISSLSLVLFWFLRKDIANQVGGEPNQVRALAESIAAGYLQSHSQMENDNHVGIFAAVLAMQKKLSEVISAINSCSCEITQASQEVSKAAQSLSQSTCEQAASIEQTSATLEQLTSSVERNHQGAAVTEKMAADVAVSADKGGQAVNETVEAMIKIAEKISSIEEIAYQTNLLSLNASIVAAKAGQHGAGFSVVATEVRKLATRSQNIANEISELANYGVSIAKNAGNLLNEILPNIRKTAELVEEIASASEEQSSGIRQINQAVLELDKVIQQNAASSEQLAATAEQLNDQTQTLVEKVSFFKMG